METMSNYKKMYDLVVATRSYESQGETKKVWLTIGAMIEGQDGKPFVTLARHVNLAGLPFKEGSDNITVSCFVPRDRDDQSKTAAAPTRRNSRAVQVEDEPPF